MTKITYICIILIMINNTEFNIPQYIVTVAKASAVTHWNYDWTKNFLDVEYNRLYLLKSGRALLHLFNAQIELQPGYIYLVPAYTVIRSELVEPMEQLYIHFQTDYPCFELMNSNFKVLKTKINSHSLFLFETVIKNLEHNSDDAQLRINGAMNLILADFIQTSNISFSKYRKFENVFTFINDHISRPFSIDELSSVMGLNTVYFSNLFKQTFHSPPKQYIINKRIEFSLIKLSTTNLSIKEIAYACGFQNEHYFMKLFKSHIGLSPSESRNKLKKSGYSPE